MTELICHLMLVLSLALFVAAAFILLDSIYGDAQEADADKGPTSLCESDEWSECPKCFGWWHTETGHFQWMEPRGMPLRHRRDRCPSCQPVNPTESNHEHITRIL